MKKVKIYNKLAALLVLLLASTTSFAQLNYWTSSGGGIYTYERVSIGPPSYPSDFNVQGTSRFNGMATFTQGAMFSGNTTFSGPTDFSSLAHLNGGVFTNGTSTFNGTLNFYSDLKLTGTNKISFDTYGGGFYMQDNTWIRTYGSKDLYVDGNVRIADAGYIDDDGTFGEIADDWIHLNGYIGIRANNDNIGIVLRDKDNANGDYLGITQVSGSSYLSESSYSSNYFIKGTDRDTYLGGKLISPRLGLIGTYNSTEVQGIWSIGKSWGISTVNNDFGSQYGIVYAHENAGTGSNKKPLAGFGHQILFTGNGIRNVSISMSSGNAYFKGDVGIGITSPDYKLDVDGTINATEVLVGGQPLVSGLWTQNGSDAYYTTGNLGVGTQTPTSIVSIKNAGGTDGVKLIDFGETESEEFQFRGNFSGSGNTGNSVVFGSGISGWEANIMTWRGDGNVGIGQISPNYKLDVNGTVNASELLINGQAVNLAPDVWGQNGAVAYYTAGAVGIGVDAPSEMLEVNGNIRTKEVNVTLNGWPDYVFEPTYSLPTLKEVETHIQKEKHLPNVPSAAEVEEKGVNLGEMQSVLLEKIEELTLYSIQMNKKMEELEDETRNLKDENASLKARLEKIENNEKSTSK